LIVICVYYKNFINAIINNIFAKINFRQTQMYILNIETSTKNCSVAIAKSGEMIICKEVAEQAFSHSEKLHIFIDEIIKNTKISYTNLSAVAISAGPGSYTGLRIGVAAAKGFCFALDIPLIALDSLCVLAKQLIISQGLIIPILDARRMEVYTAIFDENHHKISDTKAIIIDENSFDQISGKAYFIGDGVEKCKSALQRENFMFTGDILYPSAKDMCRLSFEKFQQKEFENLAYFEPFYLKEFFTKK